MGQVLGPGPSRHLDGGAGGWAGRLAARADCIRQTIIDPARACPWCLISINSSWKELARDPAPSPPPVPSSPFGLSGVEDLCGIQEDAHLFWGHRVGVRRAAEPCLHALTRGRGRGQRARARSHPAGVGFSLGEAAAGSQGQDGITPTAAPAGPGLGLCQSHLPGLNSSLNGAGGRCAACKYVCIGVRENHRLVASHTRPD